MFMNPIIRIEIIITIYSIQEADSIMSKGINETIKWLEDVRKEGASKVFTMYLNTDPSDPNQQGDEWRIHLKNGLRNFDAYLQQDDNKAERENFLKIKEKITSYIKEEETNLNRGVIAFASGDDDIWFVKNVQMRVDNEFYWKETPELNQLIELKEMYPKIGIVLVQQNQVKVINSESNRILDTNFFELDIETEDWRVKQGPRNVSAAGSRGPNVQKDNFESRYSANVQRWYKKIAPKLDKIAKDNQWEKIYIVGESDGATELCKQMNKPIEEVVQKNMLDHDENKVLEEVLS